MGDEKSDPQLMQYLDAVKRQEKGQFFTVSAQSQKKNSVIGDEKRRGRRRVRQFFSVSTAFSKRFRKVP